MTLRDFYFDHYLKKKKLYTLTLNENNLDIDLENNLNIDLENNFDLENYHALDLP